MDTNLEGELSEDLFHKEYFIESSIYKSLNQKMDSFFNSNHQLETNVYLYGYSGTGKSTYLRWYAKNHIHSYNIIFFDMADVCNGNNSYNDCCDNKNQLDKKSIKLFDHYFYKLLCRMFSKYSYAFNKLLPKVFELRLTDTNSFSPNFFNRLEGCINNANTNISTTAFMNLISSCSYRDLLTLLLFFYYSYPTEFSEYFEISVGNKLPLLIIFDNIDHVELEYYNAKFPQVIESTYREVIADIRNGNIKRNNFKFTFNNTIRFIFCLRDANCSIINRQLADITIPNKVEFMPPVEESDIFLKRISIARKYNIQLNKEQFDFLKFVLSDEYTRKSFQPLFNYNMRKMAVFLWELAQETDSTYIYEINNLSRTPFTRYGSRGIEYYLIIRHLLKNDFLEKSLFLNDGLKINGVPNGYVNPVRILLTNILNKSRYSLDCFMSTSNINPINHNTPIGLDVVFLPFNEIFENEIELYFKILANLFLFHKENWCHLVTIFNKQVFSEDDFRNEKKEMELLAKICNKDNISNEELATYKQRLNAIKVQLNPAGFAYIHNVTRHYEFFSVRAHNNKPLFCSLGFEVKKNDVEFEFIENVNKTFKLTKKCLENLTGFLDAKVVDKFSSSAHCFRTYNEGDSFEKQNSGLHSIRIIDTHITYIDTFRLYILDNYEYLSSLNVSNIKTIRKTINRKLLNIIEQYILFLIKIDDDISNTQKLICVFKRNIEVIKKSGYTDCNTSVNTGRNEYQ